jgi:hypothetical protein
MRTLRLFAPRSFKTINPQKIPIFQWGNGLHSIFVPKIWCNHYLCNLRVIYICWRVGESPNNSSLIIPCSFAWTVLIFRLAMLNFRKFFLKDDLRIRGSQKIWIFESTTIGLKSNTNLGVYDTWLIVITGYFYGIVHFYTWGDFLVLLSGFSGHTCIWYGSHPDGLLPGTGQLAILSWKNWSYQEPKPYYEIYKTEAAIPTSYW